MQMYPHWNARLVSLLSFWKIWRRIVAHTDITNIKYCLLSISHWATIFRRDNYRYGQKKKKRKRDKTDDPGITDWQCDWVSSLIHIYGFCWELLSWLWRSNLNTWERVEREQRDFLSQNFPALSFGAKFCFLRFCCLSFVSPARLLPPWGVSPWRWGGPPSL